MKNPSDYRAWMQRAFLYVEGSLLQRSAQESPGTISEDFVRDSLVQGLKAAKSSLANDVDAEIDTPWNIKPDLRNPSAALGQGRSRQHDVGWPQTGTLRMACEVKWLKSNGSKAVMEDIWKLALTHGSAAKENDCCRTFFLVGGLKKEFQKTIEALRRHGVPLRWSPNGKAQGLPKPSRIQLGSLCETTWGFDRLAAILNRRDNYFRTPPETHWDMRATVLARSWKTIRNAEWKIALWELDFRQPLCRADLIDWSPIPTWLPYDPPATHSP
jgi:hypothetical protein